MLLRLEYRVISFSEISVSKATAQFVPTAVSIAPIESAEQRGELFQRSRSGQDRDASRHKRLVRESNSTREDVCAVMVWREVVQISLLGSRRPPFGSAAVGAGDQCSAEQMTSTQAVRC